MRPTTLRATRLVKGDVHGTFRQAQWSMDIFYGFLWDMDIRYTVTDIIYNYVLMIINVCIYIYI